MKVLLIEDKDVTALLEKLELEKFKECKNSALETVESVHRKFHYEITTWFNQQGYKS